jgi:ADP-heptose:LPS heptosyltransferase
MDRWENCRELLIVRLDNMGDILMSSPAIAAMKKTFGCSITMLTSSMGVPICRFIPYIDEVIVFDAPWVKAECISSPESFYDIISELKKRQFDSAVIFTVCSQNPLPAALMLYLAGVSQRLAYCRENPYQLLTHWIPDREPYEYIQHQVERDLNLVRSVGASANDAALEIKYPDEWSSVSEKLTQAGMAPGDKWVIFHPSVSEKKREYDSAKWMEIGRRISKSGYRIVLTGTSSDRDKLECIAEGIGPMVIPFFNIHLVEFLNLIAHASLILTVNTVTVHIAAAVNTPVVVLYAETNPQHIPWKVDSRVFTFPVSDDLKSKNEILRHIADNFYIQGSRHADPAIVAQCALEMLSNLQPKDAVLDGPVEPIKQ